MPFTIDVDLNLYQVAPDANEGTKNGLWSKELIARSITGHNLQFLLVRLSYQYKDKNDPNTKTRMIPISPQESKAAWQCVN